MPFKRGKSHVTTLSRAYQAAYLVTKDFRKFMFDVTWEIVNEGAFYSETGPEGHWLTVADRVTLTAWAMAWLDSPEDNIFTVWTTTDIKSGTTRKVWKWSWLEHFLIRLDDLALPQKKLRQRGRYVRLRNGKLDVAEAVPIKIRIPHL